MGKEDLTYVYEKLRSKLRTVASGILKSDEDISDAIQESFCRLWNSKVPETLAEAEGRTVVTLKRVCIDSAVRSHRMASAEDIPDGCVSNGEDDFSIGDLRMELLSHLTPVQRKVFVAVALEERSYEEVSEELGISYEALRTNLCRARKTLREIYRNL